MAGGPAVPPIDWGKELSGASNPAPPPAGAKAGPSVAPIDWTKELAGIAPGPAMAPTAGDPSNPLVRANTTPVLASSIGAGSVPVAKATGGILGLGERVLGDASGMVTGLPGGLAHMAADLGKSSVNNARDVAAMSPAGLIDHHLAPARLPGESDVDYVKRTLPFGSDTVSPTVGTARTVAGGAQGAAGLAHLDIGHGLSHETATKYAQHPLGSLVSDALGASLVLGPLDSAAGQVLGEGSTAGAALTKAAEVAHTVANAPMKPYEFAAGRIAATEPVANLAEKMKAGATARQVVSEQSIQPFADEQRAMAAAHVPLNKLSPDEQAAAVLEVQNELGLDRPAIAKLTPDQQQAFFARFATDHPSDDVTPAAVQLAYQHGMGTLPAEQAARLDSAIKPLQDYSATQTAKAVAGVGQPTGKSLPEEQRSSFAPLPGTIDAATEDAMKSLPKAQKLARSLRAKADQAADTLDQAKADASAQLHSRGQEVADRKLALKANVADGEVVQAARPAKVNPTYGTGKQLGVLAERARAADAVATRAESLLERTHEGVTKAAQKAAADPLNAPTRLRPMLYAAGAAGKQFADIGRPDLANEVQPTLAAIRAQGLDASHLKGGLDEPAKVTGRPRASLPSERSTSVQSRRTGNLTEYNAPGQAGLRLGELRANVANEFAKHIANPENSLVTPASAIDGGRGLTGKDLAAGLGSQGQVPWDPTKAAGTKAYFPESRLGNVSPEDVTPQTLFMPKALYDAFSKQERSIPTDTAFDKVNRIVRKDPMLMNPAHHVLVGVSNAASLAVQGDLPHSIAQMREVARLLKTGDAPAALYRGGLEGDDQALMDSRKVTDPSKLRDAAGKANPLLQAGRAASKWIDNASRITAYVAEKGKGYSDEEAVRRANAAVGDFNNLGPTERGIVTRAVPIYPWLKHLAGVAGKLASDHPLRTAFALHAGDMFTRSQPAGLPPWMKGAVGVGGGKFEPTDLVNPFGTFTSLSGGLVSPLIKGPLALATGLNTNTMKQYTRPGDGAGPLAKNPGEAAYVLAGMNPLTKFVRDMTEKGGNVRRYQTGEPIITKATGYKLQPGSAPGGKLAPLVSLAGIPLPEKVDLTGNLAKTAKVKTAAKKAAAIYKARVKAAGG